MSALPYREILNNIVTKNRLQVSYSVTMDGPDNAQRWISVYVFQGTVVIGRASSTTKIGSKELAAWQAITWLESHDYRP